MRQHKHIIIDPGTNMLLCGSIFVDVAAMVCNAKSRRHKGGNPVDYRLIAEVQRQISGGTEFHEQVHTFNR